MKIHRKPAFVAVGFVVAGCGGVGSAPAIPSLEYGLPEPAQVSYRMTQAMEMAMSVMGQEMATDSEMDMTLAVGFQETSGGVRVAMSVTEATAESIDPMTGATRADEGDIEGDLVLFLTGTGDVTVESLPEISGDGADLFQFLSMAHAFFPHLPGTAAEAGSSWTGTIAFSGEEGQGFVDAAGTAEYTVLGDTLIDGRSLLKVSMTGVMELAVAVSAEGADVEVSANTEGQGVFLWDASAGLLVEMTGTAEGLGSATVVGLPDAIPLAISSETRIELVR